MMITREEVILISLCVWTFNIDCFAEMEMIKNGYPAYTTSIGWLGYEEKRVRQLCREAIKQGYEYFKIKVGQNIDEDKSRLKIIRQEIGEKMNLMIDANQCWDVDTAIEWMKELAPFKPLWIEEPTSADDALGHSKISKVRQFSDCFELFF